MAHKAAPHDRAARDPQDLQVVRDECIVGAVHRQPEQHRQAVCERGAWQRARQDGTGRTPRPQQRFESRATRSQRWGSSRRNVAYVSVKMADQQTGALPNAASKILHHVRKHGLLRPVVTSCDTTTFGTSLAGATPGISQSIRRYHL
eukprot:2277312-Prymnesium_polylepis.1